MNQCFTKLEHLGYTFLTPIPLSIAPFARRHMATRGTRRSHEIGTTQLLDSDHTRAVTEYR
jgi:hypothetical protein